MRQWNSLACFCALRVRHGDDRPGVLARHATSVSGPPAPTSSRRSSASSARNKRRYGGYIVHLGIVLHHARFRRAAASSWTRSSLLQPDEQTTIGDFTIRNDGIKVSDDGPKQMVTGYMAIFRDGKQIDTMYPARWFFRKHEERADDGSGHPPLACAGTCT